MASQQDLDQGGTFREWVNTYMGPSVGWVRTPARSVLKITAAGTYPLNLSTTLVIVDTTAAVIITMPSALDPTIPAGALPGPYVKSIITIVDIAGAPNVTINPISGAETIMGLSSITLKTAYGSYSLRPDNTLAGWTAAQ
ncbi:MAG: hypothetical protein WA736_14140 [Candidatus Acidiferrum sp.]